MNVVFDHVALLVDSIEGSLEYLSSMDASVGKIEAFPSEGTKEVYLGRRESPGRLLLVEVLGNGPYKRAMNRRGPGLHHIGLQVVDVEDYVGRLAGTGWFLHPSSLDTIRSSNTAWLARPGVPVLIEVYQPPEGREHRAGAPLVSALEIPEPEGRRESLEALRIPLLSPSPDRTTWITIGGRRYDSHGLSKSA